MSTKSLTLLDLFPRHLNAYGDRGNLLILRKRAEWRDIAVRVVELNTGDTSADLEQADLIVGGSGEERALFAAQESLMHIAPALRHRIAEGTPALAVGSSYVLFGEYYTCLNGEQVPGAGVFSLHTLSTEERRIGNIVVSNSDFGELIGYENHSSTTFLHQGQDPLAQTVSGFGNNGEDGTEGARANNAFGTYLHGPLLSKNPHLADALIATALAQKYGEPQELAPLPDLYLKQARSIAKSRPR